MKSYNNFITSEEYIKTKCREFGIYNYTISDGVIDVRGDVDLSEKGLSRLPIRFGTINGNFDISVNRLVSLEGCPKEVLGYFMCDNNELTSLEGGPKLVLGEYDCYENVI